MSRTTIDFGIDLGTTNSGIAVLNGTEPEVIPSQQPGQFGSVVTPSAIWFDKRGRQRVGRDAREFYYGYIEDWDASPLVIGEDSGALEFKLRMGEAWRKPFGFINRDFSPEEMSAEVLKILRSDVQTAKGEDIAAAVITVPAAFELPQCDATRRAAELAGFSLSPLLMEPVAAALAYGFQSTSDKVFWLVYDFGGGTFDAAVIQVRDGMIQVVNHAGDNYLGGKNIDWDIVDKLLVPAIAREHGIDARLLTRSSKDKHIRALLNLLKLRAEEAKINVSITLKPSPIIAESKQLRMPGTNEKVDFEYELTPSALQQIIEPWVAQSINLCKKTLREKGLSGGDIEKTILVGGSSKFPWLRERVESELETRLDFSIDPITVVARGAAVFAGTLRLAVEQGPVPAGTYKIQLEYDPVGSETDPTVDGRITPPSGASTTGLSVEIVELRSQWRSGAIRISSNGMFTTAIHAEKGRKCEFQIMLMDARGTRLPCSPDHFEYTIGQQPQSLLLTDNLGVALANNEAYWSFKKGEPPGRKKKTYYTTVPLRKNQPYHERDNVIRVPLIEGNNSRADCNREVLSVEIRPEDTKVTRDVYPGAEVEVSVSIDESRVTNMTVFIPILDEEWKVVNNLYTTRDFPDTVKLQQELEMEKKRLEELRQKASAVQDQKAAAALDQIDQEQLADQVTRLVEAAQGDPGASGEANKKLLNFRAAMYSVEDALEWPGLVQEARQQLESTRQVVNGKYGSTEERQRLPGLEADVELAIKEDRIVRLRSLIDDLDNLRIPVAHRDPAVWVGYLQYLAENKGHMDNQAAAGKLLAQGHRAIQVEPCDFEALKAAVRQLIGLLPPDHPAKTWGEGRSTLQL